MPDEPATQELKDLVAAMPAEQQAFRSKVGIQCYSSRESNSPPEQYSELQEEIHCRVLPLDYVRDNLFIFQFAVAPSHQRQGLGSQLIQYIMKEVSRAVP